MSTTTLKLPFKRFVAQVSSAPARSKSSYLALMAENLEALKRCPWREASDVAASLTGHDFTAETQFSDSYDAYKLTGNYDNQAMTEIAYAGMAAYRFTVPTSAISGSAPVASVSLPVSRDRFLKGGLHVAAALSGSAEPSTDWATVRGLGSGAVAPSSAVLAQSAATLVDGSADDATVTLDLSGVSSGNPSAYLWVYVTLEDYTDRWEMYNAKEKRLYAVEGSAMLAGDGAEVTFDGEVTAGAAEAARYLSRPISVRVGYWRYPSSPKLRFRTLHWMGHGGWRHLVPTGEWTFPAGTSDFPFTRDLETTGRRIPVGDCVLECWIDEGGGEFKPGMPYGCTIVRMLPGAVPERAHVKLTRTSTSIFRIDLADAMRASTFAEASAATDRSKFNAQIGHGANETLPEGLEGDLSGFNTTSLTRVRVVRHWINRIIAPVDATVFDRKLDLSARSALTEADLLADGKFDLDWNVNIPYVGGREVTGPVGDIANATYRIVIGDGSAGGPQTAANNLLAMFSNLYESGTAQTPTTPDPDLDDFVYTGSPVVRWSHANEIDKAYPAFCLRLYASDGTTVIYDSGVRQSPARDENGMYEWEVPLRAGDTVTYDGTTTTLTTGSTYYWAVSMMDSKFVWFNEAETKTPFSLAAG